MYVCMYVCMHACMHACMYVCMHYMMYIILRIYTYTHITIYTYNIYIYIHIYTHAYLVRRQAFPPPPPSQWYGLVEVGGGWRVRRVVWLGGVLLWAGSQRGPGSYASPTQAISPITWGVFLFSITLTLHHTSLNPA